MPLAFESVGYSYDSPKERKRGRSDGSGARAWALRDVTFTLADGEFIGLAGHTGSGKSTLIQHANGLLHPTVGRVLFDGGDLADKRVAQACRSAVGLVFQYPEHQLFAATVREDVAFGPRNLGLSDEEIAERVGEALRLVHLDEEDIGERSPFELSGGQQRRVAFAGVLAMRPRVLVMDEPVAGLDPVARAEFLELIGELHRSGLSIIMASHSMGPRAPGRPHPRHSPGRSSASAHPTSVRRRRGPARRGARRACGVGASPPSCARRD